ncbi:MAG: OmpA family protein [Bacteroidetes bacterium]|nr:OmpA family protein [Bacteroidota bacterium]
MHGVEAGLALRKSEQKTPYDRFRNRVVFPIKNEFGRIAGFGARKLDDSSQPQMDKRDKDSPKYINSPETPVYHKGKLLYGLYQNKDAIRKEDMVIIVEGYTDAYGQANYNMKLSKRRAESVVNYLVNKGVERDRFTVKPFGETNPVASNKTKEGRAKNRRVVVKLMQKN